MPQNLLQTRRAVATCLATKKMATSACGLHNIYSSIHSVHSLKPLTADKG